MVGSLLLLAAARVVDRVDSEDVDSEEWAMFARNVVFCGLIVAGLAALGAALFPALGVAPPELRRAARAPRTPVPEVVAQLDAAFAADWQRAGITPVTAADALTLARRLSLALCGTIPSLEEIRALEKLPAEDRIAWWLDSLLVEPRTHDYLAERLARVYVGVIEGPFVLYRRRRFVNWLSDQLQANAPYDVLVRQLISAEGLWTDRPETNFLTVAIKPDSDEPPNPTQLAGRVSRAFLGIRLDCAECHDHPFAPWKQDDFQGLAAFFGQTERRFTGIFDGQGDFKAVLHRTGEERIVAPRAPFAVELVPTAGSRRAQLAAWVTDPENKAFARATVNRAWAMLFGRPLVEPIDDIPPEGPHPPALTILADDFVSHGHDFRRLLRAIALSRPFGLESRAADGSIAAENAAGTDAPSAPAQLSDEQLAAWAAFPLTQLRPEQAIGGILQAASLSTCDHHSHLLLRFFRAIGRQEFVDRFGDLGEDEFDAATATIPQRLLMMNGKQLTEATQPGGFGSVEALAQLAQRDDQVVELAYLAVLTRRPTAEESAHFVSRLANKTGDKRSQAVSDLAWCLLNSTEFSWNH